MVPLITFYVLFSVVAIWLCKKFEFFNKLGAVILCYIAGITLGNCGILPQSAGGLQNTLSGASVTIALPLLLFFMDVRAWPNLLYYQQFSNPACITSNGFVWSPDDNEALGFVPGERIVRGPQLWEHQPGWEIGTVVCVTYVNC